jgi:uncharacterized membrane protein
VPTRKAYGMASAICRSARRRGLAAVVAAVAVLVALGGTSARASAGDDMGDRPTVRSPGFLFAKGRYTTIEVPGSRTHTYAHGINNRGQIAGGFDNPSFDGPVGRGHGILRKKNGRIVQFDVPDAISTIANKVNDHGEIVGGSLDTGVSVGAPGSNGFLLRRGRFTTLRVPGSLETQAVGINNRTQVVGEYIDPSGTYRGFLWQRGRFSTVDGPGSLGGAVLDINDRGQMVGVHDAADGSKRGFLLSKGRYTTFAAPGAPVTFPIDINNHGQIVGTYADDSDGSPRLRGFVLRKGVGGPFTPIDVPGALETIARGMDDRGRIVGLYGNPNAAVSAARTRTQLPPLLPRLPLGLGDQRWMR